MSCRDEEISTVRDEYWTIWRGVNMFVALIALMVNIEKYRSQRLWKLFTIDAHIGFLAVLAWCVGYIAATGVAWANGVPPGPWTAVMSVPILWTFIAGILGDRGSK